MTFAGNPRDGHVYYHAHESPKMMTVPLVILALLAAVSAWNVPGTNIGLEPLVRQSQPAGIAEDMGHGDPDNHLKAEWFAFATAVVGFLLATATYLWHKIDPKEVRRTFAPLYWLFFHKWWFDELYAFLFVRPLLAVSRWVSAIDKRGIDWLADNSARAVVAIARLDDWIDRIFVDSLVERIAQWTYALGLRLRVVQTGNVRQYVMWIVVGTVGLFVLMSLYWNYAIAGT
jgi:NADH:ubiquinone oxidoreductase subunit 5 (subunit L)/multisubunit Na+/H+ antiporter MnhA subunit